MMKRVIIQIEEEDVRAATEAAREEELTFPALVRRLIREYLQRKSRQRGRGE